jgi:uncharacterized short protein YbdD (DUF466 family)
MNNRWQGYWHFIRRLATDDSYDRYVEHHRQHHPGTPVLDRRAFYLNEQQRKWTGVQRCC